LRVEYAKAMEDTRSKVKKKSKIRRVLTSKKHSGGTKAENAWPAN
jgi:hypothetical protein